MADVLGILKDVTAIASRVKDIDLNTKIMLLQGEMYSLLDENRNLRLELEEMKRVEQLSNSLIYKDNMYYKPGDENPYCSRCWDDEHKLIRMQNSGYYVCPKCISRK